MVISNQITAISAKKASGSLLMRKLSTVQQAFVFTLAVLSPIRHANLATSECPTRKSLLDAVLTPNLIKTFFLLKKNIS